MFEETTRYLYEKNQLLDVVCQIRFPTILSIDSKEPAEFQERIRDEFPKFFVRKEPAARQTPQAGGLKEELNNYYFLTADESWRVNLTRQFIALTCSRYERWELFASRLDKLLAAFIELYHPAYFERIGLRYINAISRKQLGLEDRPWKELIAPDYLGFLAQEDVQERSTTQCVQNLETALAGGCRLKLHCGLGMVQKKGQPDQEAKFILDLDVSMGGTLPLAQVAPALSPLHAHADAIFGNALTGTLQDAMGPAGMESLI